MVQNNRCIAAFLFQKPLFMKRIALLLLLGFSSIGLRANNVHGSGRDISRISHLLPDNATEEKVKDILGTATYIDINNKSGEESWHYKNDGDNTDYYFRWDSRNDKLRTMSYSCPTPLKQKWSNRNLADIDMGATTPEQVMKILGDPNNLNIGSSGEVGLKYIYANNNQVEFQFRGGVLLNIRISDYTR